MPTCEDSYLYPFVSKAGNECWGAASIPVSGITICLVEHSVAPQAQEHSHDEVADSCLTWRSRMFCVAPLAGFGDELLDADLTVQLISPKCVGVRNSTQMFCKAYCIFKCQRYALAGVRTDRVCRVADEDDPVFRPILQVRQVMDRPLKNALRASQDSLDWLRPAAMLLDQLFAKTVGINGVKFFFGGF